MSQTVTAHVGQLAEADRQLVHAARRLVGRSTITMLVAVILTASGLVLFGLITIELPISILTVFALWYPMTGAYLLYQLVPRTPSAAPAVDPDERDLAWLADWVAQYMKERPWVRLTPDFGVFIDHGYLYIGMALVHGLNEHELRALVEDAYAQEQVDSRPGVAFAKVLAFGSLGRGLWGRRDARLSRRLFAGMHSRTRDFHKARDEQARERRNARVPERVLDRVDTVAEAWEHVVTEWLSPALELRLRHAAPYSGLGVFLDACELSGLMEDANRMSGSGSSLVDQRPSLRTHEQLVAAMLVADAPHEDDLIDWDQHPTLVDTRGWRTTLSRAVLASGGLRGRPVPSSFDALCDVVTHDGAELVALLMTGSDRMDDGLGDDAKGRAELAALLQTAARLAVIDSGVGCVAWEWPLGTVLRHRDGERLILPEQTDPENLRGWLVDLGVDPGAPLWISEPAPPLKETALSAFNAAVRPRGRRVVFTDRALWAFAHRPSVLAWLSREVDGPLAPADAAMLAIDRGEVLPDTLFRLEWEQVVSAKLRPRLGGHWWKLDLLSARGERVQVRAPGNTRDEERLLEIILGDRLHARWSWRRPAIRHLRDWLGYLCLGFSGFGLVITTIGLAVPVHGTTRVDWLEFGAASVALLAFGLLPDVISSIRDRRRFPRWLDTPESKKLP